MKVTIIKTTVFAFSFSDMTSLGFILARLPVHTKTIVMRDVMAECDSNLIRPICDGVYLNHNNISDDVYVSFLSNISHTEYKPSDNHKLWWFKQNDNNWAIRMFYNAINSRNMASIEWLLLNCDRRTMIGAAYNVPVISCKKLDKEMLYQLSKLLSDYSYDNHNSLFDQDE
jgi:hypothetical protein